MPKKTSKKISKKTLTRTQRDKLWGEDMPYSEARLIICSRILGDSVTRVFLEVEVAINPLTYETILKHRDEFEHDIPVQQLLDHAHFHGQSYGYVSNAFRAQFLGNTVLAEAYEHLDYAERAIIRMHEWMTNYLSEKEN
jgi:hypothetical protein